MCILCSLHKHIRANIIGWYLKTSIKANCINNWTIDGHTKSSNESLINSNSRTSLHSFSYSLSYFANLFH